MGWIWLSIAIILEVLGTTCMKLSNGFQNTTYSILMFVLYIACFSFFSVALKTLNVATSYAIWSGVGTALISLVAWLFFKESLTPIKVVSILLIILGVIGLRVSGVE